MRSFNVFFRACLTILAVAAATLLAPASQAQTLSKAVFAGGCFWCMEQPFDVLPGVKGTTSGYIGGFTKNPSYEQISKGTTGHTEAVLVEYDASKVTYEQLLAVFWRNIDPTTKNRQFCDAGSQYRSGIFALDEAQLKAATTSRDLLNKSKPFKADIVTEVTRANPGDFYAAEDYHQDYYLKNPVRYKFYRNGCGRDARLKELWGESGK
jgi:peptide-methionine (S)-S-oxide reductase